MKIEISQMFLQYLLVNLELISEKKSLYFCRFLTSNVHARFVRMHLLQNAIALDEFPHRWQLFIDIIC